MARLKQAPRLLLFPRRDTGGAHQAGKSEKEMRKYYPKKSKFFYNGSHYHPSDAKSFENVNLWALQRYKRSFFRSFEADSSPETMQPSRIPHNLRHLKILAGSQIFLRKLIKQNKRLEQIVFDTEDDETNAEIIKYLRYLRSLQSIAFQQKLPIISKRECRRMLKTWGKTVEKIKIRSVYNDASIMEALLQFPKLKEFQLGTFTQSFPYDKLQGLHIPYSIHLGPGNSASFESILKNQPQFKLSDYVSIKETDISRPSEKMALERCRILKHSKQRHFLEPGGIENYGIPLLPIFQDILALDVTSTRGTLDCFEMGQLNNLRHLSIDMCDSGGGSEDRFRDFFKYLNENVACHKKLETFLIKTIVKIQKKPQKNPALCFFEACSDTLRKVHFEFKCYSADSQEAEYFYEGLSKLKNLQSLSLDLEFVSNKQIKQLIRIMSEMKSLKELDFKIRNQTREKLDLKFPLQLSKLSFGLANVSLEVSKAVWVLSSLTHLELESADFSSQKRNKILCNVTGKLEGLEVLIIKKTQKMLTIKEASDMKEGLNGLILESLTLKLLVLVNMESEEVFIFKRKDYPWFKINSIVDDLSFRKEMKVSYVKSY